MTEITERRHCRNDQEPALLDQLALILGWALAPGHTCYGPTPAAAAVWAAGRAWCLAKWRDEAIRSRADCFQVPWIVWAAETRPFETSAEASRRLCIVPRKCKNGTQVLGWDPSPGDTCFLPELRDRQAACAACVAEKKVSNGGGVSRPHFNREHPGNGARE